MNEEIVRHLTSALRSYTRQKVLDFCNAKVHKGYIDEVMQSYDLYMAKSDEKDSGLHIYECYFNGETKRGSKMHKTEFRGDVPDKNKMYYLKGPNVKKK